MGYQGAIQLALAGLPAGVIASNGEIPAGATDALVSLSATGAGAVDRDNHGYGGRPERGARAHGTFAGKPRLEIATVAAQRAGRGRDRRRIAERGMGRRLGRDPVAAGQPVARACEDRPRRVRRGAVRLALLTSQIAPKKEVTENNQKRQVDDVDRTIRLEGTPTIAADQAETTATILVPADLANIPYDLAIRAELLAADGKSVVASVITPARRLTTIQPLQLELAGEPKVEAKAGTGETGRVTGKVQRIADFPHPVTVTLVGLPAEYLAPTVEVPAGASDFSLPVAFPFNSPPGDLANVSVVATARPGGGAAVNSNAVPVAVKVVAGGPPPAFYRVFDDEPHFVTLLNEGGGAATLETVDRYSGSGALRVTPDQKFRVKLPGLGVKIVEKPGAGEYRYLRYAWKKIGGGSVLLQLNANGMWGPMRGQGKAGYRYEAGPAGNTFNAEAIRTSERLPYGWTVVTRDLFADFGAFELDGLAFTPGDGTAALFDHIYLARSENDFKDCPSALPAEQPLAVFEDQPEFVANLNQGAGTATLASDDKFTGTASVKITPEQRVQPRATGAGNEDSAEPRAGRISLLTVCLEEAGRAAHLRAIEPRRAVGARTVDEPAEVPLRRRPGPRGHIWRRHAAGW